jgi:anti-sigma factor RsiW
MNPDDKVIERMMAARPSELELMAYADGELDPAAAERVRRYIETDDAAARKIDAYQNLHKSSARAMGALPVPHGLANRIEQAGAERRELGDQSAAPDPSRTRLRIGWMPAAIAAVLLLAIASVVIWSTLGNGTTAIHDSPLVPVAWVSSAAAVHANCSKHADHHHVAPFPRDLSELPASIHQFLGCDATCPDLSKLGYQFAGCAPCTVKDGKTAHLLYRPSVGPGPCVSLFVQRDASQFPIDAGKVYFARDAREDLPMIIWRNHGAMHYLVAQDDQRLQAVAAAMGLKVRI